MVALGAAWADYEGLSYFATGATYDSFAGLSCPAVLSRAETGSVSATFDNPRSTAIEQYYKVEISGPFSSRILQGHVGIAPGTSREIGWSIGPADIDLGSFILVKLDVLPSPGYRTREATCGVIVLPLGRMGGELALNIAICAFAVLTVVGLAVPALGEVQSVAPRRATRSLARHPGLFRALGITVSFAILASLVGWWTAAIVLSVVGLLLLLISARYGFA
jgi:hypothetical protein